MQPTSKPKMDRRVQRTLQSLRTALLDLIKEKDYDEISIEEITERANVGRTTFYLHYKDKEDLLMEEFSTIMYERAQALSEIPFSVWVPASEEDLKKNIALQPLLLVFDHIHNNSELYNLLLKSTNSSKIIERIRKISTDAIVKFVEAKMETDPIPLLSEVPIEFFAAFFSGALISIVSWWIREDMRHSPEEVTNMFRSLFFSGATRTLGLPTYQSNG
ncbi:MAG TPA: TetR/AcrR family transcriptional regulator [Anaerolineales bacterium]|nr:TetR/AcrR family transcriptional regulator [Anaerolineales bacterium]